MYTMGSTFFSDSGGMVLCLRDVLVLDIIGALVVHQFYKRYEVDPSRLGLTFLLLGFVPSLSAFLLTQMHLISSFFAILVAFGVFYATLIGSVVLYRLSPFHPLAKYPGPVLARVTKLYGLSKMASGKNHEWHKQLTYDKYGPYVRVGPNELSCVDANIVSSVFGATGLPKGPMWDARRNPRGVRSLVSIRDPQEHARRRKPWNRAFNMSSLKGYEPILTRRALQLAGELEKRANVKGGPSKPVVNLAMWMRYFAFDFMGDMAFGGGFETMRDGTENVGIWHALESGLKTLGLLQHLPWLITLLSMVPGTTKNVDNLRKLAVEAVVKRKREVSLYKDLFHHLIDEADVEKTRPTDAEIISDGVTAVVAGSDTTSTVLAGLFYNLLQHPEDYKRLQEEVDKNFPPGGGDATDSSKLSEMVFLNAVINETLRIAPPGNILQRGTTAATGPRHSGNNYIPEGTAIDFPMYTLFRDPRYFSPAPEEFWPDRWLEPSIRERPSPLSGPHLNTVPNGNASSSEDQEEEEILNLSAFIPFSYGPTNCVGKSLALAELRTVVALLMQRLEMQLEEGYNPKEWYDDLEDWFVMQTGRLPVVLTVRN